MQVDALKAEPGVYTAAIRVGGVILKEIEFTILDNHAPVPARPFGNQILNAASAAPLNLDLLPYFTDPDVETLIYEVSFSRDGVVGGSVIGSILNLTPKAYGQTKVTVTALDARRAKCQATFTLLSRNTFLDLDVYPNPVSDYLYIRPATEVQTKAELYSRSGALVCSADEPAGPFSPIQLDVRSLAPGSYTLQVDFGGKQQTKTIVKY